MTKSIGVSLLLTLVGAAWFDATPAQAQSGNAEKGKQIFMQQGCFRCHGTDGQGGAGRRLTPNPLPVAALIQYVRKPTGQMPAYTNRVTDADLTDIRAYLATIAPPKPLKDIPLLNQ
ncbi:MAG TPA: cytochrome c [Bryobacteraceae bacterium]|jgi:mono/diheme cytochrome c family protein